MTQSLLHKIEYPLSRRHLLAGAFLSGAGLLRAQQDAVIRVDVDRVNILFSVRDKQNAYVTGLTAEDLEIREDGKLQEIKTFTKETDLPLTLGLLVDVSGSQRRLIEDERRAASLFFRQVIRQKDMAFLMSFGTETELLQDSTNSVRLLEKSLSELRESGGGAGYVGGIAGNPGAIPQSNPRGTLMFDAVYLGAKEKLATEVGRKAMVLITDGMDQGSRVSIDEAIRTSLRSDSLIYSIYYVDQAAYGFGGTSDSALKKMADETGGRLFRVDRKNTLEMIFNQIQQEMRSQYAISYSSTNPARDGAFRKLEIRSKNKDHKVQARKGYFAPGS
ncbi:MAG: VWA domain-containing protein [Acidobacteria bacterium]|nr:VWA domain-containing protein [Acidobacteriota bacterium]